MTNHSKRKHASYSPSRFHIIENCAGAPYLWQKAPKEEASPFAEEGTQAHQWADRYVRAFNKAALKGAPAEMARYAKEYGDYIRNLQLKLDVQRTVVEARVRLTKDIYGTVDYAILYRTKSGEQAVVIIDYKYGQGVSVTPKDNPQLIIYAGAFLASEKITDYAHATLIIYQPRVRDEKTVRIHRYSKEELESEISRLIEARNAAHDIVLGNAEPRYTAGEHCRWCPAKPICGSYVNYVADEAGLTDLTELTTKPKAKELDDEDVLKLFAGSSAITKYLSDLSAYVLNRALSGTPIAGTVLTRGVGRRAWKLGERETIAELGELGIEALKTVTSLRSFTDIENEHGKGIVDHLLEKKEGSLKVVLEGSPEAGRDPLNQAMQLLTDL